MKISDLVKKLEHLGHTHGDLPLGCYDERALECFLCPGDVHVVIHTSKGEKYAVVCNQFISEDS